MKKVVAVLLIFAVIFPINLCSVNANENAYREFYVNGNTGSDSGDGSVNSPFRTIEQAQSAVREINSNMTGDIIVNIASGRYEISTAIEFEQEDSGKNGHRVIYRGNANNMPVISGGVQVTGFTEGTGGIWQTQVDLDFVRELSVNGVMADMARSENKIFGTGHYNPTVNDSGEVIAADGIYVNKADLDIYQNPSDVEFSWAIAHTAARAHVKDIIQDPDNSEQVIVKIANPFWNSIFNKNVNVYSAPGGAGTAAGWDIAFTVENAFELLDEPGEFYYNKATKILYYMPRDGENMATAEVLCPVIDRLVGIEGRGVNNKITNISFENITFAHATWPELDEYSVGFNQAEQPRVTYAPGSKTAGAVSVSWADGLNITNCHFYGISQVALRLHEGVINSNISGNTFNDIGCGAISIGDDRHSQTKEDTDPNPATRANVMFLKGWSSSLEMPINSSYINQVLSSEYYYTSSTWTNERELAENPDAKSWIKVDLGKAYDLDGIKLGFINKAWHTYTTAETSNFEILVSNDRTFSTYQSAGTYTNSYKNNYLTIYNSAIPEGKFRYIMVRKTVAEPFAIGVMYAYTHDKDRVGNSVKGLCKDNVISNNYITRIGLINSGAPAITAFFTENLSIDHNHIENIPYSGISLGWGWASLHNDTAKNNSITNNRVEDYMLVTNDGGGIYVCGDNPGTVISGNYIKDGINGYGGIYPDGGSVGFEINNNVCDNTDIPVFIASSSICDITGQNNYSTSGGILNNGTNCTIEDTISILPNSFPDAAMQIVSNAGLQSAYSNIKSRVLQKKDIYHDGPYASYSNGRKSERRFANFTNAYKRTSTYAKYMQNIIDNGAFGYKPWQYNPEYKAMMQSVIDRTILDPNAKANPNGKVFQNKRGPHIDEMYMMKYLIEDMRDSIRHLSIDEMVSECRSLISSAEEGNSFGKYQSGAIAELQNALTAASSMPSATDTERYAVVAHLENAANTFMSKQYSDEVLYAYDEYTAFDAYLNQNITLKTTYGRSSVDKEAKTITITLPYGAPLGTPKLMGKDNTVITMNSAPVLDTPIALTATNSDINAVSTDWNMIIKYENLTGMLNPILIDSARWHNSNKNTNLTVRDKSIAFKPWVYPYMYNSPIKGELRFKLKADRADTVDGISVIVASKSGKDLEYDGSSYKDTYYKLSLKGQDLELYEVSSGSPTLVATANNVGFNYGSYNDISVILNTVENTDKATIKLGDRTVLNNVSAGDIGIEGYFGILTKSVKAEIMASSIPAAEGNLIPGENMTVYAGNAAANQLEWNDTANAATGIANNIIDGDSSTSFTAKGTAMMVVDLGAEYKISDIRIKMGTAFPNVPKAYQGTTVYCTTSIPKVIDNEAQLSLSEDSGRVNIRNLYTLRGDAVCGGTVYPMNDFLSQIYKYRYLVIIKSYSYIDIEDIEVYTTDEIKDTSRYTNVAPLAAKMATTSYSEAFGVEGSNLVENNATDSNASTHYMSYHAGRNDSTSPERFIVDLGASTDISLIRYISNAGEGKAQNFTIYGANTGDFSDRVTLMAQTEGNIENRNKLIPVGGSYRYVLVEGNTAEQDISVSEIEIFAKEADVKTSEVFEVSAGLAGIDYAKSGSSQGVASDTTKPGNIKTYTSQISAASGGHSAYILIDLGAEYYLEDFAVITSSSPESAWTATEDMSVAQNFRANLKFFGLRELPDTTGKSAYGTYLTYQQAFANAIISDGVPSVLTNSLSNDSSGLCVFGLTDEARAQKYRYVGIYKAPMTNDGGTAFCNGQLCLKQLKVYASLDKNSNLTICETKITACNITDSSAVLIAASYDESGKLIDIKTVDVAPRSFVRKTMEEIELNVNNAVNVKAMLLDNLQNIKPIAPSAVKEYNK